MNLLYPKNKSDFVFLIYLLFRDYDRIWKDFLAQKYPIQTG